MTTTAAKAWVADLYDSYVRTQQDIPFFLSEAAEAGGPILDLMAGTGRNTLPLLEAGYEVTSVDIAPSMLARLSSRAESAGLKSSTVVVDIAELAIEDQKFPLIILPFQAFGELLDANERQSALRAIKRHLASSGRFICTMHNPTVRAGSVDGMPRIVGPFPLENGAHSTAKDLLLTIVQRFGAEPDIVDVVQLFELFDKDGIMVDKRRLDVSFRLIDDLAFRRSAEQAGFRVDAAWGDYDKSAVSDSSPYLIYQLI